MPVKLSKPPAPILAPTSNKKPAKKKAAADEKEELSPSRQVMAALVKSHGKKITVMGSNWVPPERLPSGIFPLDLAMGGGFPYWRVSMPYGQESSGKTVLATKAMGMAQRTMKGAVVLVDAEGVYDKHWARKHGVDTESLILVQPDNGEQAVEACEGFLSADDVCLVVLDSVASLQPQVWIDAEPGKQHVAGNTQLVSDLYTKVGAALSKRKKAESPVLFIPINQIRMKVGAGKYENPQQTSGGVIPRFVSSMSLRMYSKKEADKEVSTDMPATLTTTGAITKWRVPIISTTFEYTMAMMPQEDYRTGDIMRTWNTVGHRLQASGDLKHEGNMWHCLGAMQKTVKELEGIYLADIEFRMKCQRRVFEAAAQIAAQEDNKQ